MNAISAKTAYPNTIESDRRDQVLHIVTFEDGSTIQVYATDPVDALYIVNDKRDKK